MTDLNINTNKPLKVQNQVFINNLGYVRCPSVPDATIAIEVTAEIKEQLSFCPAGKLWKYNEQLKNFELVAGFDLNEFRLLRNVQCFSIINRGYLWYASLTAEQQDELNRWYQAWLDVTETLEIPQKPTWLR